MVVGGRELIDTLWNVNNTDTKYTHPTGSGINRYIMECKSPILAAVLYKNSRINRYIMECKFKTYASRVCRGCMN